MVPILSPIAKRWSHQQLMTRMKRQLTCVQNRTKSIRPSDVLLVSCLRNEKSRMAFFCDYYRRLGVNHFLFIDNDSSDGFRDWAKDEIDVSVWHTTASYKSSRFGMNWCNFLLNTYGVGHLCVTVDPDEFLVYPHAESRNLHDLGQHLKDFKRESMSVIMLDAYSDRPLSDTILHEGEDPFEVCPFFDRDGYIQTPHPMNGIFIRGGPRMRYYTAEKPALSPALNKISLVWWQPRYRYVSSMLDMRPWRLNQPNSEDTISVSGCLFHFKFVSSLKDKAEEERTRRQHYAQGREYEQYRRERDPVFYEEGLSVRYQSPRQLVDLGLINVGDWV